MTTNMRGFTLIETLVAVLLLSLAIAGPLTIASKGLHSTIVAKDQFIAFYLAQDAMEYVRYVRDSNCLTATPDATGCPQSEWLTGLSACISADGTAKCNVDSIQATSCTQGTSGCGAILRYNDTSHLYTYNESFPLTQQQFTRSVSITYDNAVPDEAILTVTVTWQNIAGVTHAPIVIRENIFRWQ